MADPSIAVSEKKTRKQYIIRFYVCPKIAKEIIANTRKVKVKSAWRSTKASKSDETLVAGFKKVNEP